MEEQLACMREQLAALDRRLTILDSVALVSRQNAQAAAVQMMATYHRFTSRGYAMHDAASTQFLRSFFADDVRCTDFTGLTVFLQQWEYFSLCHASITVAPKTLDVLATETLEARSNSASRYSDDVFVVRSVGTTTLRISRATIERIFPHVLEDEPLVQWLIGKEYAFAYTMVVHVNADGRIFQLESRVDLTSALLDLLKDPLVTLQMIEAAAMTRAGNLLLQTEVRDAQNTIENGVL